MELQKSLKPRRLYAFTSLALFSLILTSQESIYFFFAALFSVSAFRSYKNGTLKFEDINIPLWPAYSSQVYRKLTSSYEEITSFDEVNDWDNRAQAEIVFMNNYNQDLELQIQSAAQKLTLLKLEFSPLTFFKKHFRYRTHERYISHYIKYLNSLQISSWQNDLQNKIDFSPNNKEEQKLILAKLQDLKADLNLDIKNVAYDIKEVKDSAKIRNAEINSSIFSNPKSRRLSREANSRDKNNKLLQLENHKRSITQKVHSIEKQIDWVKRIKDSKKTSNLDIKAS